MKTRILELGNLAWVTHKQNIILTGPTGSGKSHIAQALGHQACRNGYAAHFVRLSKLLSELSLARGDGSYHRYLARLIKFNALILDDWGIAPLAPQEQQDLLEVIEERYEIASTIVTTQLSIKHWHEFIGNETIADAICDRLVHNAYKIELNGKISVRELKGKVDDK